MTRVGFEPHSGEETPLLLHPKDIVAQWDPHPAHAMGLALAEPDDESLGRWWVACCLMAGRCPATRVPGVCQLLDQAEQPHPRQLANSDPARLAETLTAAKVTEPERAAALLVRSSTTLRDAYDGSLARLGHGAENLEDLAGRLSQLAPGFGRASVARFLQPLRDAWPAAEELPLDSAARAAAEHLGWIPAGADEDGYPSALRSFLKGDASALPDIEFALAQLGRRACLRERSDRCPLGEKCPLVLENH